MDSKDKREQEKKTIYQMIKLYCHHHHHEKELCPQCAQLYAYACHRIEVCPFMETKTFCSNCNVHCYEEEKREAIRQVMRYSGWRMLFHQPLLVLKHLSVSRKEKP